MKRKTLIIVIASVVALGLAILLYFLLTAKKEEAISETVKAIPANACVVFEIRNFEEFEKALIENSPIWKELSSIPVLKQSDVFFKRIKDLKGKNKLVASLFSGRPLMVSLHLSGKDKIEVFYALPIPEEIDDDEVLQMFKSVYSDSTSCTDREFEGTQIYDLRYKLGKRSLSFSVYGHILLWSNSSMLVEESINQLKGKKKNLSDNPGFTQVYKSAGQKEIANIYILTSALPSVFSQVIDKSASALSEILTGFAGWMEFDLSLNESRLAFSGFTSINDSLSFFSNLTYNQDASDMSIETILPANTSFYLQMSFTKSEIFKENLNNYLLKYGNRELSDKRNNEIAGDYNLNLKEQLFPLINQEIGMATVESDLGDETVNYFLIIKVKSKSIAENEIKSITQKIASANQKPVENYISELKIDEEASYKFYNLTISDIGNVLFGPMFASVNTDYVCFVDNYMIFSGNKDALYSFVRPVTLNKTMATDLKHSAFMSGFSKKSNLFLYINTARSKSLIQSFITDEAFTIFGEIFGKISQVSEIGIQFSVSEGMLYNYAIMQFDTELREEPKTIWASKLDSTIVRKPVIVINHGTQGKEIIVQDKKNILHLLSESGREIWKIPVDGQINSDIYQVDAFNNGKLQYLFSTETQIHLIDRLGNYCDRFPVTLREKTISGMALFDYDNNKSYRIVVPCSDKKVYLYDIEGKIVKGWEFNQTENIVNQVPAYYNNGGTDFIVFNDKYKLYIIDRRGLARYNLSGGFQFSKNNKPVFDAANGKTSDRFIASDVTGIVYSMYLNGKTDSIKFTGYSENHYFTAYDIDNDGIKEYIFADGSTIDAYKPDKSKVFSINLEGKIESSPYFYKFSRNQIKIGVVCIDKQMIYLLNDDGTFFDGFPLRGISPFSIGYLNNNTGSFNLVTGGEENFLYNYEIKESAD